MSAKIAKAWRITKFFEEHDFDAWRVEEWTMDNGQWRIDNGQLTMDNGELTIDNGQWTMHRSVRRDARLVEKPNNLTARHEVTLA